MELPVLTPLADDFGIFGSGILEKSLAINSDEIQTMNTIGKNLASIHSRITDAELETGRQPGSVQLIAVGKTKPAADLAKAYVAGQRQFAESYLQEALNKQIHLGAYEITWHFIGPIQSNKTRPIASHFSWVHSVDRLKIAHRLNEQRPAHLPPLNICLQINISDESSKSGFSLLEMPGIIDEILKLPNLRLRGVMAIPAPETDFLLQCEPYRRLFQAVRKLKLQQMDTFSFGMSGDLKAAIAEGATMVRIGTALFGARNIV